MKMSESLKVNAFGIGIFSAFTAALIAVTFVFTQQPIEKNIRVQKSAKLFEIVDKESIDNDLLHDSLLIDGHALGYSGDVEIYFALKQGKVKTIIFPVKTAEGYSGDISLLVGLNRDASVAGVRVVSHTETPGLGDKIELKKSPWILSLNDRQKTVDKQWAVKKDGGDFDQFTGATITPRAVVKAVGTSIDYFKANKQGLIDKFQVGDKLNAN